MNPTTPIKVPSSEVTHRGEVYGRTKFGELVAFNSQIGWVKVATFRAWVQARKDLIRARLAKREGDPRTWEARGVAIGTAGGEIPRIVEGRVRRVVFS